MIRYVRGFQSMKTKHRHDRSRRPNDAAGRATPSAISAARRQPVEAPDVLGIELLSGEAGGPLVRRDQPHQRCLPTARRWHLPLQPPLRRAPQVQYLPHPSHSDTHSALVISTSDLVFQAQLSMCSSSGGRETAIIPGGALVAAAGGVCRSDRRSRQWRSRQRLTNSAISVRKRS